MRVHPTGRGHEDDKNGQEGCSTTANASLIGQTGDWLALQDLTMVLPSRLGCPLSLKTPNMGNVGSGPGLYCHGDPICHFSIEVDVSFGVT